MFTLEPERVEWSALLLMAIKLPSWGKTCLAVGTSAPTAGVEVVMAVCVVGLPGVKREKDTSLSPRPKTNTSHGLGKRLHKQACVDQVSNDIVRKHIHIQSPPEGVNLSGVWENCMLEVKEGGWVG